MRIRLGLILGALLGCGSHLAADVLYSVTDLGTLGGGYAQANALNNTGQVTGASAISNSGPIHAFLYSNGQMIDLDTLGNFGSNGRSINDAGQVVGDAALTVGGPMRAFLYSNGQMINLGTLGGNNYSSAYGIN
ncbi:MAG: hypothetical protein JO028_05565, partial [Acidobacteriaceae bacterium]|nr:hypothetical protein [Acidobacteriaceae bacterium]